MDTQTLGAAIAICGKQTDAKIEGIIGTVDDLLIQVQEHKLVITEKEGEE